MQTKIIFKSIFKSRQWIYLKAVKFVDVIAIFEPETTRNPALENIFEENNELVISTELDKAYRKTMFSELIYFVWSTLCP